MKVYGVISVFFGYNGFFKFICISINEVICYGIFYCKWVLQVGDIINVDVIFIVDGYYGDCFCIFFVGIFSLVVEKLVKVIEECLCLGIEVVKFGGKIGDIGVVI